MGLDGPAQAAGRQLGYCRANPVAVTYRCNAAKIQRGHRRRQCHERQRIAPVLAHDRQSLLHAAASRRSTSLRSKSPSHFGVDQVGLVTIGLESILVKRPSVQHESPGRQIEQVMRGNFDNLIPGGESRAG